MGLLDNIEGQVMNRVMGSGNPMAAAVLQMIQNQPGGLQGLIQCFRQNGLGGVISSWVGTGQNQAISPEQIQQVLGNNTLQQVAEKAGVSPDQAKSSLADLLPTLVDKLTPNGQVPEHSSLLQMGESLLSSLGKSA
ncbi:MAG TPA: YidB family protein [Terriglobales bacterium]|nr:YidB family protein [Terriglobales bacterium]